MTQDDTPHPLEELLAEYLALRDAGDSVSTEEFLARHPEGGPELARALRSLGDTERLLPPPESALPDRAGIWRIRGVLGRGGMGIVLHVDCEERQGESFALKLLDRPFGHPRAAERFRREVAALRRVSHAGVVRVVDEGVAGDRPFFVMERVEGRSLARIIAARAARTAHVQDPEDPAPEPDGEPGRRGDAALLAGIARALAAVHAEGVLHRDLKPANILVREDGSPVLVDFGVAHDIEAPDLTRTGDIVGTPSWMSPEQARGVRIDARSDIYALGAVAYELLALVPPHTGESSFAILERIVHRPPRRLARAAPDAPPELIRIVEHALAWHPHRRYASAADFAADLEAFARGGPVSAPRRGLLARYLDLPPTRRRSLVAAVASVITLLALLSVFIFDTRNGGQGRDGAADLRRLTDRAASAFAAGDMDDLRTEASALAALPGTAGALGTFLLALAGDPLPDASPDPAVAILVAGERARRAGDADFAITAFRRAGEALPDLPLSAILLALSARKAERLDLAETELTFARRRLPGSSAVARLLGRLLCERRRPREAIPHLEEAVRLDPDDPRARLDLARAHLAAGDVEAGLAVTSRAVLDLGIRGREIENAFGASLDAAGRRTEAREIFRRIVAEHPDHVPSRFNLARSLDADHRLEEALAEYNRVLEIHADHAETLAVLAWLHAGACSDPSCRKPHFPDADRAEDLAVRALLADRGRRSGITRTVVEVALRTGRTIRLREAVADLLASSLPPDVELDLRRSAERLREGAPAAR